MKITLLTLVLLLASCHAFAGTYQDLINFRDKTQRDAIACSKKFKTLNDDQKFECLMKGLDLNTLNIRILEIRVAEHEL